MISGLFIAGLVLTAAGSVTKTITNHFSRKAQRQEAAREIQNQMTTLTGDKDDALDLIQYTRDKMQAAYDNSVMRYGEQASTLEMQRSSVASQNAYGIESQKRQAYDAVDDLIRGNSTQLGSINQNAASSGFRKSGTIAQNISSAEGLALEQQKRAIAQAQMQTYASVLNASNANIEYYGNIDNIRKSVADLKLNLNWSNRELDIKERQTIDKYNQQYNYLKESKKNIDNYSAGAQTLDIFGDIMGDAASIGNMFISNASVNVTPKKGDNR